MKLSLMPLAFLVLAICAFSSMGNKIMSRDERVTKLLIELSPNDAPGIQYIIVNKDTTIYSFSSGLADIKNRTLLSLSHTLSAFSMTKTLTAIAILQLVERQGINIDDRVSKYIEHPYGPEISIRQLLNHSSGIPNPIPLKWVHLATDHKNFNENAALAKVLADNPKPDRSPGEKYAYSNIGYWLLGRVIEAVSKQNYAGYVKKNIFQPLQLTPGDIEFVITDNTRHAKGYLAKYSLMNLAKGFVTDKTVWGRYEGNWLHIKDVYVNGLSFGGAIGSAKAFSRILQDLLTERSILLSENSKRLLYSQQKTRSGKYIDMTLGWHVGILGGVQYFYKEGGGAGFHSEMRIYPTIGLASVIMTNKTSFNSRKQLSNIDKMFFDK
jgi:CubicO group peptidase (beta-lactamase class C family)